MNKPMSFAERMAALKKNTPVITATVEEPAVAVAQPSPTARPVFGQNIKAVVPEEKPVEEKPAYEVGNIILLANEANKIVPKDKTEGEQLVQGDLPEDAIIIKQKIASINNFDGISLRYEMDELKKLIKASPDACMFLLPEELGLTVRALRRMTDNKVAVDMGSNKGRTAKKPADIKLSAAEISAALDDL